MTPIQQAIDNVLKGKVRSTDYTLPALEPDEDQPTRKQERKEIRQALANVLKRRQPRKS
ncbi:hypothetical protein HY772_10145 [Candidatus Woesearchaeota archaeon]|nr:hypothetical protein [Candidatus Woesearchaeota archaeon]